jgi:phosphate transport system substrate-binding protein
MQQQTKTTNIWLAVIGLSSVFLSGCGQAKTTLQGTGATFPAPLYKRWFQEYNRLHPDIQINYQATGSGAGEQQFLDGLVDFGGTDAAFSSEVYEKEKNNLYLLPLTAGSIVLAYNIPGIGDTDATYTDTDQGLRLSREVYVAIFLGDITSWDDPRILECNPKLKDQFANLRKEQRPITVVRRAESSGTTFVFTQHLSAVSPQKWGNKNGGTGPGTGKRVVWPVGVGGKNNSGVAALIKQTPGAIGYLEFQYAKASKLPTAALQNKAGEYLLATPASSKATLAEASKIMDEKHTFRVWISDPVGKDCYPIVTYTWMILKPKYVDREGNPDLSTSETLKEVLLYCLGDGQKISEELGYVPLPEQVADKVREAIEKIKP